jgi:3,4-dihydroxy 2-butanone 4-phosphate synthase/GTP cyclohydrolase II
VQTAVQKDTRPEDLRQPGHIFPLMAQPGGVLTRAGHTEAGCDFARLAGFEPAAVIVEILNEDGTMARRPDLERYAREHGLKIGTIADLIRYRLHNERSVERIAERAVETAFGVFQLHVYEDHVHSDVHLALVRGPLDAERAPLVRVHIAETLRDVLGVVPHGSWSLRAALARVAEEDSGVVLVLRTKESPRDLVAAVQGLARRHDAHNEHDAPTVLRTYGIGAQILRDLGVTRMRVLSAPKQMHGISAFGLEVVGYVD